jgi:hypothetical protein
MRAAVMRHDVGQVLDEDALVFGAVNAHQAPVAPG